MHDRKINTAAVAESDIYIQARYRRSFRHLPSPVNKNVMRYSSNGFSFSLHILSSIFHVCEYRFPLAVIIKNHTNILYLYDPYDVI